MGEKLDLNAIRKRCEAATPGPWETASTLNGGAVVHMQDGDSAYLESAPTAAFIAAAREDVPALLAEVERLRAAVEEARAVVDAALFMADYANDCGLCAVCNGHLPAPEEEPDGPGWCDDECPGWGLRGALAALGKSGP